MPDDAQEIPVEEQKALITKMVASEAFKGTRELPPLLWFLFNNCGKLLSAKDIEVEHFGRSITSSGFDPGHARERVAKLKERLGKYDAENPDEFIKCELPDADDVGGYQLRFRRLIEGVSACRRLWAAHLESEKQVSVVCDPLLFYFEFAEGKAFRFADTNIEGLNRKAALSELKVRHKRDYKEALMPGHFYIDVGSIMAAELIRNCFRNSARIDVPLVLEKEAHRQWLKSAPVVIGTARSNSAIKSILGSPAALFLSYHLHPDKFGWISIKNFNEQSEVAQALKALNTSVDADGDFLTPAPELTIGIVSRIANPGGTGAMTFICSDGTFTTKQIAAALTDEKQLRRIFGRMGWRLDQPVPTTFEMMFLVRLWPGDMADEGAEAELLGGRNP
jgi:hypothetical protein